MSLNTVAHNLDFGASRMCLLMAAVDSPFGNQQQHCCVLLNVMRKRATGKVKDGFYV